MTPTKPAPTLQTRRDCIRAARYWLGLSAFARITGNLALAQTHMRRARRARVRLSTIRPTTDR